MKVSLEKLKNIKLIVFDLDGTLLNDSGAIQPEIINKIRALNTLGVKVTIATGRIHGEAEEFAEQLNLNSPLVSSNGATVIEYPSGKEILINEISVDLLERIIKLIKRYNATAAFITPEKILSTGEFKWFLPILKCSSEKFLYIKNFNNLKGKIIEIIVLTENLQNTKDFLEQFKFPSVIGLKFKYFRSAEDKNKFYIRIRKTGYSKALAVKELAEYLNIKVNEIAAVGGGFNDRSLFAAGFFKVAVANALPELKEAADYITERTNNEGAAQEFLDLVIKSRF